MRNALFQYFSPNYYEREKAWNVKTQLVLAFVRVFIQVSGNRVIVLLPLLSFHSIQPARRGIVDTFVEGYERGGVVDETTLSECNLSRKLSDLYVLYPFFVFADGYQPSYDFSPVTFLSTLFYFFQIGQGLTYRRSSIFKV